MGVSRIEQLIEDIYEFVEGCKMSPLSSTKVVVPKDELYDLLDELRLRTPDEIKRYQKIVANRDAILSDAEAKAEKMIEDAKQKTENLVNEHEIMQQAYYQANQIVEEANNQARKILASANEDANQIRTGALAYSEDMLNSVEIVLQNAFDSTKAKAGNLIASLEDNLNIVKNNRKELTDQLYDNASSTEPMQEPVQDSATDSQSEPSDFEFDEDSFLNNID